MKKKMYLSEQQIEIFLAYFVSLSLIIDIGGRFGLKYLSFFTLFIYFLYMWFIDNSYFKYKKYKNELFIFILFPLALIFLSLLRGVYIPSIVSQVTYLLTWILFPLFLRLSRETILDIISNITKIGCIIIIITFLLLAILLVFDNFDLIEKINSFCNNFSLGYIGLRRLGDSMFFPNVYFRWTLLLIPGIIIWSKTGDKFLYLGLSSIFLTLSTGAIIFTLLGVIIVSPLLTRVKLNRKQMVLISLFLILLIILLNGIPIFSEIFSKFNISSESTSTKILHIYSILENLSKSLFDSLFGMGIGSSFYSLGTNSYVINVEVSHFNMVRQFGLIYSLVFFIYVFDIAKKLSRIDDYAYGICIGLLMLFFAAGTNPLLLSPVFFFFLILSRVYLEVDFVNESEIRNE